MAYLEQCQGCGRPGKLRGLCPEGSVEELVAHQDPDCDLDGAVRWLCTRGGDKFSCSNSWSDQGKNSWKMRPEKKAC